MLYFHETIANKQGKKNKNTKTRKQNKARKKNEGNKKKEQERGRERESEKGEGKIGRNKRTYWNINQNALS